MAYGSPRPRTSLGNATDEQEGDKLKACILCQIKLNLPLKRLNLDWSSPNEGEVIKPTARELQPCKSTSYSPLYERGAALVSY